VLDKLHKENYNKIQTLGRARINATKLFDYLEENPIIDISKTALALDLSYNTISLAVKNLMSLGVLNKTKGKTYANTAHLDILKKGT
jgi:predicted transcriptional regulator